MTENLKKSCSTYNFFLSQEALGHHGLAQSRGGPAWDGLCWEGMLGLGSSVRLRPELPGRGFRDASRKRGEGLLPGAGQAASGWTEVGERVVGTVSSWKPLKVALFPSSAAGSRRHRPEPEEPSLGTLCSSAGACTLGGVCPSPLTRLPLRRHPVTSH